MSSQETIPYKLDKNTMDAWLISVVEQGSSRRFIQKLPTEPSANIWGNVHGNTEIGKLASMKILEVEPENTGTYMSLCLAYMLQLGDGEKLQNLGWK
ncbi:hypothetical protein RHGRI_007724 [Rhododendron griersonianum]|uniref:Uncharacterized protein n=1 Tax=Rhododendron griersonianum TaxID=479676 RepID=A0AAV6KXZ5_9ERIC|nr:hypothetical protein RHGRI_007724 [Rhododendron griersonianum]